MPRVKPTVSCAGSATSNAKNCAVVKALPPFLTAALNVTFAADVLHTANVDITALAPAGTEYKSAYVAGFGNACPKTLYAFAICFPYIPASKKPSTSSLATTIITFPLCCVARSCPDTVPGAVICDNTIFVVIIDFLLCRK